MPPLTHSWVIAAVLVLALSIAGVVATPAPAWAGGGMVVSPSSGLDPGGSFVVVSGSGFAPNVQLFVMQCKGGSGSDHTCNSVGLRKVTTDSTGSFTANAMRVVGRFGATDCLAQSCAIMTSAVSGHSGDRSQDVFAPISFAAASPPPPAAPDVAPPAAVPPAGPAPTEPAAPTSVPAATNPPTTTSVPEVSTTIVAAEIDDASSLTTEQGSRRASAGDEVAAPMAIDSSEGSGSGGGPVGLILGGLAVVLALAGACVLLLRHSNNPSVTKEPT